MSSSHFIPLHLLITQRAYLTSAAVIRDGDRDRVAVDSRRLTVSLLFLVAACAKTGTIGTVVATEVKDTAPSFVANTTAARSGPARAADTWGPGSGSYEIFQLLRAYKHPQDEGKIDMSNMYKTLSTMEKRMNDAEASCEQAKLAASKSITAPFAGFSTTYDFSCAFNEGKMTDAYPLSFAMKREASVTHALYGFQWAKNAEGGSVGVIQARLDTAKKDLLYEMVNCVNCGAGGDRSFTVRSEIQGNSGTHAFSIRSALRNAASGVSSFAGKGVSQGAGSLMLFKHTKGAMPATYYCLASDAKESDFAAATGAASAPTACASLAADVDAMPLFVSGDLPFALADFSGSTILFSL
ncbi:MAG: hypothetical protein IT381_28830 [Deltaproteobacteria bacterium]|nr:hypothetical protein [Deltaproteobacteria bacterium]